MALACVAVHLEAAGRGAMAEVAAEVRQAFNRLEALNLPTTITPQQYQLQIASLSGSLLEKWKDPSLLEVLGINPK